MHEYAQRGVGMGGPSGSSNGGGMYDNAQRRGGMGGPSPSGTDGGGMHNFAQRGGGMAGGPSSSGTNAAEAYSSAPGRFSNNNASSNRHNSTTAAAPPATMPGYPPGSAGPLGPLPTRTAGPQLAYGYGNFGDAAGDARALAPAAGGAARPGGVPHQRPRSWMDPPESVQQDQQVLMPPQAPYSAQPGAPHPRPRAWMDPSDDQQEAWRHQADLAHAVSLIHVCADCLLIPALAALGCFVAEGAVASSRPSSSGSADPRFRPVPGSIGYSGVGKTGPPFNPNRSSLDVMSKMPQPKSLWQTSNQAIGGIFNPASSMRASRWNAPS
ncbi:hypothetical protein DUNSADRAFT_4998 [Dunaliella salina]|uniref:Encoded protein n=1 Tax=Dunaliella salina TaxID=3046 RepID=A0ABQ7GQU8_DUNSA|nr:hypothetical protein DUNSADRAFT_4998 [Dunaliella salina]|eukprot:KAF5836976.1 hypothetical protein DUNSADRAFT_4998 [Dunaliella salina]